MTMNMKIHKIIPWWNKPVVKPSMSDIFTMDDINDCTTMNDVSTSNGSLSKPSVKITKIPIYKMLYKQPYPLKIKCMEPLVIVRSFNVVDAQK